MITIIIAVTSVVIIRSIKGLSHAQWEMSTRVKVESLCERVAVALETDVGHTYRMFAEDSDGRSFLARMELDDRDPLAGSRMPVATSTGTFEPDPVDEVLTGNLLFLAAKDGHLVLDTRESGAPDPHDLRVDTFRFVAWFLEEGRETGVDLSRWSSVRIAKHQDLGSASNADQLRRLAAALFDAGVHYTWNPNEPADTAFQSIDSTGSLSAVSSSDLIPGDPGETDLGIFSMRFLGIAANGTVGAQVPLYAQQTETFPHGFELKRDGDGSGDLLMIRIVGATPSGPARTVLHTEATRQVAFREE